MSTVRVCVCERVCDEIIFILVVLERSYFENCLHIVRK